MRSSCHRGLPNRALPLLKAIVHSYKQFCGVALALDVLGERWTLLIVRDLMLGPRRYSDLHRSLAGITTNLLAARLKMMEAEGLVEKRSPESGHGHVYALTREGRSLEALVLALGAFGARYMKSPRPDDAMDPRWAMLSLKRRYRGSPSQGTVGLTVGTQPFCVTFGGPRIDVRDGSLSRPQASLSGEPKDWFQLLTGTASLASLIDDCKLAPGGSRRTLNAFCRAIGTRVR